MSSEFCPVCLEKSGVQNRLSRLAVSFEEVITVCSDPECVFMKDDSEDVVSSSCASSAACDNTTVTPSTDAVGSSHDWLFQQVFSDQPITDTLIASGQLSGSLKGHPTNLTQGHDSGIDTATGSEADSLSSAGSVCRRHHAVPAITPLPRVSTSAPVETSTSAYGSSMSSSSVSAAAWDISSSTTDDVTRVASLTCSQSLPGNMTHLSVTSEGASTCSEPSSRGSVGGLPLKTLGGSVEYEPGVTRCYRYRREKRTRLSKSSTISSSTSPPSRSLPLPSPSQHTPPTTITGSKYRFKQTHKSRDSVTIDQLMCVLERAAQRRDEGLLSRRPKGSAVRRRRQLSSRQSPRTLNPQETQESALGTSPVPAAESRVAVPRTQGEEPVGLLCKHGVGEQSRKETRKSPRRPGLRPRKSLPVTSSTSKSLAKTRKSMENVAALEQMLSADSLMARFGYSSGVCSAPKKIRYR